MKLLCKGSLAMAKGFRNLSILIFSILICLPLQAQYMEPSGSYNSKAVVRRLSYENFKNIRLLTTAIMNFGGKKTQFDKLVDEYSNASSLYFSNEFEKSAKAFKENERNIRRTALSIAKKYKQDTDRLHRALVKFNVKKNIALQLAKKPIYAPTTKLLNQASSSRMKAHDLYARSLPVKAIDSFRRAKEDIFYYYRVMRDRAKADENKKEEDKLNALLKAHKKDLVDNKNQEYKGREKKN
jgi:hypothetical protein